jgi:hypothetical protein
MDPISDEALAAKLKLIEIPSGRGDDSLVPWVCLDFASRAEMLAVLAQKGMLTQELNNTLTIDCILSLSQNGPSSLVSTPVALLLGRPLPKGVTPTVPLRQAMSLPAYLDGSNFLAAFHRSADFPGFLDAVRESGPIAAAMIRNGQCAAAAGQLCAAADNAASVTMPDRILDPTELDGAPCGSTTNNEGTYGKPGPASLVKTMEDPSPPSGEALLSYSSQDATKSSMAATTEDESFTESKQASTKEQAVALMTEEPVSSASKQARAALATRADEQPELSPEPNQWELASLSSLTKEKLLASSERAEADESSSMETSDSVAIANDVVDSSATEQAYALVGQQNINHDVTASEENAYLSPKKSKPDKKRRVTVQESDLIQTTHVAKVGTGSKRPKLGTSDMSTPKKLGKTKSKSSSTGSSKSHTSSRRDSRSFSGGVLGELKGLSRESCSTPRSRGIKIKSVTSSEEPGSDYLVPTFAEVRPLLLKGGCVFRRNLYCRPGMDPSKNKKAKICCDYFESEKEFRDDLCAYGVDCDTTKWSEDEKALVEKWVRYAIVRSEELKDLMPESSPMSSGQAFKLLSSVGFNFNKVLMYNTLPGVDRVSIAPGMNAFATEKELLNFLARFGLPCNCEWNKIGVEDRLRLELFLTEPGELETL